MTDEISGNKKLVLPVIVLSGTPFEMGRAFGSINPVRVLEIYESRLAKLIEYAAEDGVEVSEDDALAAAAECLPYVESYSPEGYEELSALAAVCMMTIEQVWLINAYTDLRDHMRFSFGAGDKRSGKKPELEGCSAFFAAANVCADGVPLLGQTWDLGTEDMERVVAQHRKPKNAPEVWTITVAGAQPMIGMNECGISCLTNDLNPGDGRPGVCYLDILSKVLRQKTLDAAIECVTKAPRLGGHHYLIADGGGNAVTIETSARAHSFQFIDRGVFVHTNHYIEPDMQKFERTHPPSSVPRFERMTALLNAAAKRIGGEFDRGDDDSISGGSDKTGGAAKYNGDGEKIASPGENGAPGEIEAPGESGAPSETGQSGKPGMSLKDVHRIYSDREGDYCINRYDDDTGSSTNACLIMSPVHRKLWMCRGQADRGEWIEAEFGWPEEGG